MRLDKVATAIQCITETLLYPAHRQLHTWVPIHLAMCHTVGTITFYSRCLQIAEVRGVRGQ